MADQPEFKEDFFQRIVNVNWTRPSLFVAVTLKGQVYHVDFKGNPDAKLQSTSLSISNIVSIAGIDCKTINKIPTFVIAGTYALTDQPFPGGGTGSVPIGFVCTSADGAHWRKTWETNKVDNWNWHDISAIVYSPDEGNFYLSGATQKGGPAEGFNLYETLYSSSDGSSFSVVSETEVTSVEMETANRSTFPGNYCNHNKDCDDDYSHSVPGGIMWYDKTSKVQMRPDYPPTVYYRHGGFGGATDYHTLPRESPVGEDPPRGHEGDNTIRMALLDKGPDVAPLQTDSVGINGLAIAVGVAGSSGTWMAGGFTTMSRTGPGAVALTKDKGQSWEIFGRTSSGVVGVVVGDSTKSS